MNRVLEFTTDSQYDIVVNKNRNVKATLHCVYIEEGQEMDFNFNDYEEAIMHVKKRHEDEKVILALSTVEGTIELQPEGRILFKAEPDKMNIRAGEYVYDLYLFKADMIKRAFLSGKFIVNQTVTN